MAGIHDIARASGLTKDQVDEVFQQVLVTLCRGECVRVNGFGTFRLATYKGRTLTTPAVNDGKPMVLPDTLTVKFKQSGQAKQTVNSNIKYRAYKPPAKSAKSAKSA